MVKIIITILALFAATQVHAADFAEYDPTNKGTTITLSNSNLTVEQTSSGFSSVYSDLSKTSGKWFWEINIDTTGRNVIGVSEQGGNLNSGLCGQQPTSISYDSSNGQKIINGAGSGYGASFTVGDKIGVALDLDNNTVEFFKNGTSQGIVSISGLNSVNQFACDSLLDSGTKNTTNFGQNTFTYTIPTGFNAGFYSGSITPPTPPTPPPAIPGVVCNAIDIPDITAATWWDFFDLPFSVTNTGAIYQSGAIVSRYASAEAGNADFTSYDSINANGVNVYSTFYTGGLVYPGTQKNNLTGGAGAVGGQYIMNFQSTRNSSKRTWNILQFFGVTDSNFGRWGNFYNFDRDTEKTLYVQSGTVTLSSTTPVLNFGISAIGGFNGMRVGTAGTTRYYQCEGGNGNRCELSQTATGVICGGYVEPVTFTELGNCAFVNATTCAPLTQSGVVVAPNPAPGQVYTVDGSGAVTVSPYYVPPTQLDAAGIFDCQYEDWTDILGCAKEILQRVAKTITQGTQSIVQSGDAGIKGIIQNVGTSTGELGLGTVSGTGANLADRVYIGVWNESMGGTTFFSGLARMGLYGAFLLMAIAIFGFVAIANRK